MNSTCIWRGSAVCQALSQALGTQQRTKQTGNIARKMMLEGGHSLTATVLTDSMTFHSPSWSPHLGGVRGRAGLG